MIEAIMYWFGLNFGWHISLMICSLVIFILGITDSENNFGKYQTINGILCFFLIASFVGVSAFNAQHSTTNLVLKRLESNLPKVSECLSGHLKDFEKISREELLSIELECLDNYNVNIKEVLK